MVIFFFNEARFCLAEWEQYICSTFHGGRFALLW